MRLPPAALAGLSLAVVAVIALAFALGRGGSPAGDAPAASNPLQERSQQLAAEKRQRVERGEFLPPIPQNIVAVIEEQGTGWPVPNPELATMSRYDAMPDVPATDLFGLPTGDDPAQWYNVAFCDAGGGISVWDVNPHTINAFQSSLSVGTSAPLC